jgi:ATP-dependent Clp protease protease subunit
MNWKTKNKWKNDEKELFQLPNNMQPIIINAGNEDGEQMFQQMSAPIRVVENKIFFYGDIDEQTILELNRVLVELDLKLQNLKNALGNDYDPIIHLHVNTYGGSVFAALAAVDTIRSLKSKVYTYADGSVASAGTLITAIGHRRYIGQHGHLLIHQLSSGMYGKFSEMEDEILNATNLMKLLKEFYKNHTKVPMKKLEEILKKDIWLQAEECIQFGLVDEIL